MILKEVAQSLDHGESFDNVVKYLRTGYASVMIDVSGYPFRKNIALIKKVTQTAHAEGVPIGAELWTIGGVEG